MGTGTLSFDLKSIEKKYRGQIGYFYGIMFNILIVIGHYVVQKISMNLTTLQILYWEGLQVASYNYITMSYNKMKTYSANMQVNRMLLMRALLGFSGAGAILTGLTLMPLSEAVVIQMMTPVVTGILAIYLLGEKYDFTLTITTAFSFFGVVLISQPEALFGERQNTKQYPYKTLGVILTLIGSLATAIVQLLVKKLGAVSNAYTTAYFFGFGLAMCAPVGQIIKEVNPITIYDVLWIFLLGILRFAAHIFNNKSFAVEDASKITALMYIQLPTAYIIDLFIVGIQVDMLSVIGSVSVFSCIFIMIYKNYMKEKAKKALQT